ncbi:MAG: gamma-glutamyl-gamma-aminobutyrate hydrolase family protein [Clostridia bacterium]|nr:gamma-glutamyl-gamma-aminobutyrate hydrolase family protein [Clostridia bacterium]
MRPVIGLTHSIQQDEKRLMMPMSYSNVIRKAGGTPILLPITRDTEVIQAYAGLVDGVLFSGGEDVDPAYFGEDQLWACGDVLPLRDEFELTLCRLLLEKHPNKPILGICRGEQVLNVAAGGTLYQDLKSQLPGCIAHSQHQIAPYTSHKVTIEAGSQLHAIYRSTTLATNSFHHQAVKDIAPSLTVTARASDGVIEAFEMPGHPYFIGVQWHPERLVEREENAAHKQLFKSFVDACRK